jgi:prevent-host-death family protein
MYLPPPRRLVVRGAGEPMNAEEPMKTIPAGEFKAKCLKLMDEVRSQRSTIVITKKGRPVAKLTPPDEPAEEVLGCLAGKLEILGDITAPVVAPEDWEANR